MPRYDKALNYEFQRLGLAAVSFGDRKSKNVTVIARGGQVKVPGYRAVMALAEVRTDKSYYDRENALTAVLSLGKR